MGVTLSLWERDSPKAFRLIPCATLIGTKLAHYEITSHLGTGGMGEVYQATDLKLGRSVAINRLPEALSRDSDYTARFDREAKLLASRNKRMRRQVPLLPPSALTSC
jgi:serine/threonine protein kinase